MSLVPMHYHHTRRGSGSRTKSCIWSGFRCCGWYTRDSLSSLSFFIAIKAAGYVNNWVPVTTSFRTRPRHVVPCTVRPYTVSRPPRAPSSRQWRCVNSVCDVTLVAPPAIFTVHRVVKYAWTYGACRCKNMSPRAFSRRNRSRSRRCLVLGPSLVLQLKGPST